MSVPDPKQEVHAEQKVVIRPFFAFIGLLR